MALCPPFFFHYKTYRLAVSLSHSHRASLLQQSPAAPSPIDVRFVLVTGGPVSRAATGYGKLRSSSASESSATSIALASLAAENENYSAMPATMSTPESRAMTIGFIIMLLSVSAGMHFGAVGFGLLLCFLGVLVGASLAAAGVSMADGSTPIVLVVFASARAIAAFVRRNTAVVGLVKAPELPLLTGNQSLPPPPLPLPPSSSLIPELGWGIAGNDHRLKSATTMPSLSKT